MARTSWQVMWVLVVLAAVLAAVVSAGRASSSGDLFALTVIAMAGVSCGLVGLLVLAPLFCLGASVRSRTRPSTMEEAPAAPPLAPPPPAAEEGLTPQQQELIRRIRAVAEASPPPALRPDLIPRWRVAALVARASVLSVAALVCLAAISHAAPSRRWTTKMSGDDRQELARMLTSIRQDPNAVDGVKRRFWKWIDSHGGMSEEDLDAFRAEQLTDLRLPCLYWEDALLSLERGRAVKSAARERLEADLLAQRKLSDWECQQDEADMEHIAAGKPVPIMGKEVVITEEMARAKRADCERQREAVTQLLTPPAKWRPRPSKEWPPSHEERVWDGAKHALESRERQHTSRNRVWR